MSTYLLVILEFFKTGLFAIGVGWPPYRFYGKWRSVILGSV